HPAHPTFGLTSRSANHTVSLMKHTWGALLLAALTSISLISDQNTPETRVGQTGIEQWTGKRIMVFSPHPDDDVWGCGGTLALLAKNGNQIRIVVYTNDD